jgi:hypothetical protein
MDVAVDDTAADGIREDSRALAFDNRQQRARIRNKSPG